MHVYEPSPAPAHQQQQLPFVQMVKGIAFSNKIVYLDYIILAVENSTIPISCDVLCNAEQSPSSPVIFSKMW